MAAIRNVKSGDLQATAQAVLALVDAPKPSLRLILSNETWLIARRLRRATLHLGGVGNSIKRRAG
ncbi:hypothetical protein HNQ08_003744 [Deinococcus humi]|uniref:Transposase n=1 Tax=Deinococcus humi TaxID=662880 RepID=A0A7W8JZH2_9DEIO|nr:hypothetical protein [Deinococcus humi]GGO39085.1 hypothetical protein GCM10008949_46690 [Deinococcus humi]